jgi:uncharacterized membrane protein
MEKKMASKTGLRYPTISALVSLAILIFALCIINTPLYPAMAVVCLITVTITAILYLVDKNLIGLIWVANAILWLATVLSLFLV